MAKAIKKRAAKKKPVQESEVKGFALQALSVIKEKQKQTIIIASAVVVIVILYIIFALYSSAATKKAYSLETEAYKYYYGTSDDDTMSDSDKDKWKKAMELFQKSIDVKVTPTALFYLGNCYFNSGDFDNAIRQYNAFVDKFSSETGILPLVYQKLASAYFKSNQNDKALETLGKLAEVENGIFKDTALALEARYYETAGEAGRALEKYREISTEFPASPWSVEATSKISAEETRQAKETSKEPGAAKSKTSDKKADVKKEEK